jgi:hypothetical protein
MAAYPTSPAYSIGSKLQPIGGKQTEFSVGGTLRARLLYSAPGYRITLPYTVLSSSELDLLTAHWSANNNASFAITYEGVSYTVQYEEPGLEWSHLGGDWYSATAHLIGKPT